jgi:hypothetical protein
MLDCHDDTSQPRAAVCAFRPQPSRERIGRLTCKHPERCAVCDRSKYGSATFCAKSDVAANARSCPSPIGWIWDERRIADRTRPRLCQFQSHVDGLSRTRAGSFDWLAAISALTALHGCLLNSNQRWKQRSRRFVRWVSTKLRMSSARVGNVRRQARSRARIIEVRSAHRRASPGADHRQIRIPDDFIDPFVRFHAQESEQLPPEMIVIATESDIHFGRVVQVPGQQRLRVVARLFQDGRSGAAR